jgi:hypothetical protein
MHTRLPAGHHFGYDKFFRGRLLVLNSDQISNWIDQLDKEAKSIKSESLKMVWYMRGGLSYEAALNLSTEERSVVSEIIKDNLETTKKSGLPFF